jgi:leucyl-tRNA synthetase
VIVKLHKTIRKVGSDIENLSYNTAISALMELHNEAKTSEHVSKFLCESFAIMLAPFAPHLAEEIWHTYLGYKTSVFDAKWPEFDPALTVEDTVELAVQVNSKVRSKIVVAREAGRSDRARGRHERPHHCGTDLRQGNRPRRRRAGAVGEYYREGLMGAEARIVFGNEKSEPRIVFSHENWEPDLLFGYDSR